MVVIEATNCRQDDSESIIEKSPETVYTTENEGYEGDQSAEDSEVCFAL